MSTGIVPPPTNSEPSGQLPGTDAATFPDNSQSNFAAESIAGSNSTADLEAKNGANAALFHPANGISELPDSTVGINIPNEFIAPELSEALHRRSDVLRSNLRLSVWDGGFYGLMVGIGETFLPPFALALSLGEVVSGLVTSLPVLIGGLVQLVSLRALPWSGSYQKWIVAGVLLQAFSFIPFIYAASVGSISPWAFFAIAALFCGSGMMASPAWNVWIGSVVPSTIRPHFFANRTRVIQLATLSGFLIGGWLLQVMQRYDMVLFAFATIFTIAGLARCLCAICLAKHRITPSEDIPEAKRVALWHTWRLLPDQGRTLILYLVAMQACVQFSGPYFVPYIIKQLNYSYGAFAAVIASALVARVFALSMWGWIARRWGAERLFWIGGFGLIPLASLWVFSGSLPWLIFVQVLSGLMWSAYELAFFLLFLEKIPARLRADSLTLFNLANSVSWFVGAIAGGWWIAYYTPSIESYHGVFALSSLGRLFCLVLLWKYFRAGEADRRLHSEYGIS